MKIRHGIFMLFLAAAFPSFALPTVNVFSSAGSVTEGLSAQFIFKKEGAGSVRVPFTVSGTAVAGVNFNIPGNPEFIIIPDGVVEFQLQVYTLRDRSTNTDVTLFLKLSADPSYQIGPGDAAGIRIVQSSIQNQNFSATGQLAATQWATHVDFQILASDPDYITALWLLADTNVIAAYSSFASSTRNISTNFSWINPPLGHYKISVVVMDARGVASGLIDTPPLEVVVGGPFTYPTVAGSSTNGNSITPGLLLTTFDTPQRHRRLLVEFAIPASATNSEGYLDFSAFATYLPAATNEIYAYFGDGLLSTNDLSIPGEPVARFVAPPKAQPFQIDITPVIRSHAGSYLALWINPVPDPSQTNNIGTGAASFAGFKLEIPPDSQDEPTTAIWLNPPLASRIPFFQPATFSFQVVDRDSRVTSVELYSQQAGLLARSEGMLFLGTNIVFLVWTNPVPGNHTVFLKTFNEDNATSTIQLGQLQVDGLDARVIVQPQPADPRPSDDPFPVEALIVTPTGGAFQVQLALISGEILDRKQIDTVAGTNHVSLAWTNAVAGGHTFVVQISDAAGNTASGVSSVLVFEQVAHEWLYSGNNFQSMHVVDAAGRARVWGYGFDGDLGLGYPLTYPHFLSVPTALPSPPPGLKWKQIASSTANFTGAQIHFGLTSDGSLYGWGYNFPGMFLFPTSDYHTIAPTLMPRPPGVSWWRNVVCSLNYVAAIDQNQDIWTWGPGVPPAKTATGPWLQLRFRDASSFVALRADGSLSLNGKNKITLPAGVKATREFAAAAAHYLAIGDDGQLYAWGSNANGELPFPSPSGTVFSQPTNGVHVAGAQSWTQVAATTNLSLAVDNNGRLFAWGSSTNTGARNPVRNEPSLVDVPETGWLDIAVTPAFAMALSQRGNLYVWGTTLTVPAIAGQFQFLSLSKTCQTSSTQMLLRRSQLSMRLMSHPRMIFP